MTVKTQRQGDTIVIPIPDSFNIGEDAEYQAMIDENGVIRLIPVRQNIFESMPKYDLRKAIDEERIGDNGSPIGNENVWNE
ncbi:type II toxin-antitoxin system PemI/MazE family antitoxin [Lacticaseibacillus chiayiensis]|uniref:type II toxin-antitoxin system PemI/MazE family antitoxin n=1 Tax=Lacticaseibacillus chiayiensis TaxID=2100821 RepID=UPI0010122FFF|nr:hypothetical protein [Lacticaseibacillus chiayiensis]RXT58586.1 hypothetical protein CHT97_05435 [Lacticaseibacillus chiayiensis]